jgi:phosphoribosylaminoimidazolecarboxamide formyltransferase/IMP cyclohydrolase
MKLAGMASNRGRTLRNIADRAPGGAAFAVVLTNDADAPVLDAAEKRGIPTEVVERPADQAREDHEARVLDALADYDFDLVCMDGYMRILSETFLEGAPTTLNVHPSLLPSFPGMSAHADVLDAGVKTTGCTVHVVDETVDDGPIVTQEPIPVYEGDDTDSLKERVLYQGEFRAYPRAVEWFAEDRVRVDRDGGVVHVEGDDDGDFPVRRLTSMDRAAQLRYGENPHQDAAVYADPTTEEASIVHADQLNPEAGGLSYNNYNDADGALDLIKEFDEPAAAVIKHTSPAGCATADRLAEAYERALSTDPKSAFGGVVSLNRVCDAETAAQVIDSYKVSVIAPGYTGDALDVLTQKESIRILDVGDAIEQTERFTEKDIVGGRLVQERDRQKLTPEDLDVVTEREPTEAQIESMLFGWQTVKHVTSNAVLFATGTETVGVGAGQLSRVDAVKLAKMKAESDAGGKDAQGGIMASDAYFPFPDNVEVAAEAGIEAVIQPGGSKRDDQVIEACDDNDMAMVFTGQRCFRHD